MCLCRQLLLKCAIFCTYAFTWKMLFTQCNVQCLFVLGFFSFTQWYLFRFPSAHSVHISVLQTCTTTPTSIAKKGLTYQELWLLKLKCLQHPSFICLISTDQIIFPSCGTVLWTSVPPVCSPSADRQVATELLSDIVCTRSTAQIRTLGETYKLSFLEGNPF